MSLPYFRPAFCAFVRLCVCLLADGRSPLCKTCLLRTRDGPIKGCVGFSHIEGSWFYHILLVRGKRVIRIPLFYPLYILLKNAFDAEYSGSSTFLSRMLIKKSDGYG